ncbi:MAG TPA: ATPase, T2SS/T4P/T4SS family, partial [Mycobacterium sp.]
MSEVTNPLLELVREQGLLDDLQYEEVSSEHKRSGEPVFQILQNFGILDADAILQTMANYLGAEVISLQGRDIPAEVIATIPSAQARALECLPVEMDGGTVKVATVDPLNPSRMDEVAYVMKRDVQLVLADPTDVRKAIEKHYSDDDGSSFSDILKEIGADEEIAQEVKQVEVMDDDQIIAQLADAAPIVKFVNMVLFQAVKDRASDIHFEPFETEFRIRYRVDGALYEMSPPPKHLALPVISRIKVMANLN